MNTSQIILEQYTRLRDSGMTVKNALSVLRDDIEALSEEEKQTLARRLRQLEGNSEAPPVATAATDDTATRKPVIKRLKSAPASQETITCPNCGKSNKKNELLCYACGHLLVSGASEFETRTLRDAEESDREYFGEDSALVLRVRDSGRIYELYPGASQNELIIGRSAPGSAMMPDVDLVDETGALKGVSRLHLTIRYDLQYHTLSVFDLGSANGSFINGQRLHPHEVRVLRDGDEMRLGTLAITVAFRHVH